MSSAWAVALAGIGLIPELTRGDAGYTALEGGRWDEAPCRFCGTGCGVLMGIEGNDIAAIRGDPESAVNRGLLCLKGYNLLKIHSAADRLQRPLIRTLPKSITNGAQFREA